MRVAAGQLTHCANFSADGRRAIDCRGRGGNADY